MKKSIVLSMLAVAATAAFVSCNKVESDQPAAETFTMQVAANAPETKVTIGDKVGTKYPVTWDAEGEAVKMIEIVGSSYSPYTSSSYTVKDGGASASFLFSDVKKKTSTTNTFDYYFVSPASAYNTVSTSYKDITMTLPQNQTSSATSVDPAAAILYGKNVGNESQLESVSADMASISAIVKLHLKEVPMNGTEEVQTVTFSSTGKTVSGKIYYYYEDDTIAPVSANSSVVVTVPAGITAKEFDVWLTCWPFELAIDDVLSVSVATDENTYSASYTMSAAKSIAAGKVASIPVNMDKAKPVDYSGTYVVLAKYNSNYYAMSSNIGSNSYLPKKDFTYDGTTDPIEVSDTDLIWNVSASGSSYIFQAYSTAKYMSCDNSWNVKMLDAVSDACKFTLTNQNNNIFCVSYSSGKLRYNTTSPRFKFYTSATGTADLIFVKAIVNADPVINPITAPEKVEAAGAEGVQVSYSILNPVAGKSVSAVSAESWVNNFNYDTEGKIIFDVEANSSSDDRSSEITVSYEGAEDVKFTVSQSGAGAATVYTWTLASGQLKTAGGTYAEGKDKATWSYTSSTSIGFDAGKGVQIGTSKNPTSSFTISTDYFSEKSIKSITVNASIASSGTAKLSISVGGNEVMGETSLTTRAKDYTVTGLSASGTIEVKYTNTAKAFYLKSITVEYK